MKKLEERKESMGKEGTFCTLGYSSIRIK